MKTVKLSVAKLISENAIVPNHKIMAASAEHPLSGLQRLRELKKAYNKKHPFLKAYKFSREHNEYEFFPGFRFFCGYYCDEKSNMDGKENDNG